MHPQPSSAWAEGLSFAAAYARDCLELLAALQPLPDPLGVEPTEYGYELEGAGGETRSELEIAWPWHQVAVVLQGSVLDDGLFDDNVEPPPEGWRLFPLHTPAEVVLAALQP
jgi:hypothetical protein